MPQFEESVIGLTQGVPTKIQVVYPENCSNNELAGKTVDFSVVVREIKQKVLSELDDDFAKDHGECGSLAELRTGHPDAPGK